MATTDTELQQLVINVGTEAQILAAIEGGTITENMLSISTDGGSSGSVDIDGTTISTNTNDELQAIGLVNKNVLTSSRINPIYDWVGTYNEWVAQDVATNHPDWFCYITDDAMSNQGDINVAAEVMDMYSHRVISFQPPTPDNNYTWYRLYADNWVEQGGKYVNVNHNSTLLVNLPIEMANAWYITKAGCDQVNALGTFGGNSTITSNTYSTTQIRLGQYNSSSASMSLWWEVCGMVSYD